MPFIASLFDTKVQLKTGEYVGQFTTALVFQIPGFPHTFIYLWRPTSTARHIFIFSFSLSQTHIDLTLAIHFSIFFIVMFYPSERTTPSTIYPLPSLFWLSHPLCRETQRDVLWYHVPSVNAATVVWPLSGYFKLLRSAGWFTSTRGSPAALKTEQREKIIQNMTLGDFIKHAFQEPELIWWKKGPAQANKGVVTTGSSLGFSVLS